ncbi:hypothetical protein [Salinisphaera sp. G21_0]|uniref:hypothetical protein n=1 Tax=Salinisphaera sp. G21_0 TaxID=2821094 RepID=UPI001ADAF0EE|nr:hypothetical protein [Salinisphaera sp. G21_0]MBO9484008.1 hypothetical protein [Salinisphaera sp. G21_0]
MNKSIQSMPEYEFGKKILGPFFSEFCRRLWLYHEVYAEQNAVALFCARGGIRLRILYERFLEKMEIPLPVSCRYFMISRLLASKVCFPNSPELVLANLRREFFNTNIATLAKAFLPKQAKNIETTIKPFEKTAVNLKSVNDLFFGKGELTLMIRSHIKEQTQLFKSYLIQLTGENKIILLVDSGLFGSTQMLLSHAYYDKVWFGHYVARSNYRKDHAPHFPMSVGIILEHDFFTPRIPETALLKYWHLIEATLEPQVKTVEYLEQSNDGTIVSNLQTENWVASLAPKDNSCFSGILSYFDTLDSNNLQQVRTHYEKAIRKISNKIQAPSKLDLLSMSIGCSRSHDFGRKGTTSILHNYKSPNLITQLKQIHHSLWPEGQLVNYYGKVGTLFLKILLFIRLFRSHIAFLRISFRQ